MHIKLLVLAIFNLIIPIIAHIETLTIPNTLHNGLVVTEFVSQGKNIDGQKLLPGVNASTYEWWYFDIVSTSSINETFTVIFYEVAPNSFLISSNETILFAGFYTTFKNGTTIDQIIVPVPGNKDATITTSENTIHGDWQGTGLKFTGKKNLAEYIITFNNSQYDIYGTIKLESIAPGHLPCGPNTMGATEQLFPHVGWANIVPGALGTVDLTFRGEKRHFTGIGYHDKNWGDVPFTSAVKTWYWGHALMGPYTLVFFDGIARDGKEYVSGYVAKDNVIQASTCMASKHSIRPWGANSTFPPQPVTGSVQGLAINFTLYDRKVLSVNLTNELPMIESPNYSRYLATLKGSIVGCEVDYRGKGLWEVFKY